MSIDWMIIVTGVMLIGFVYVFLRSFRADIRNEITKMKEHMELQDERIFQLATGKTLKEAMAESKREMQGS